MWVDGNEMMCNVGNIIASAMINLLLTGVVFGVGLALVAFLVS